MSEQAPVYSGNGLEKFLEHVGHDVHVVFSTGEKLVADLPKYIKAAQDAGKDVEAIVPLVQNVITASLAFAKPAIAIGSAVAAAGINLAADGAALSAILGEAGTLQTEIAAFVAAVKALAQQIGVDWNQLIADMTPAPIAAPVSAPAAS